ncbi:MAG: succinate dehydrogenase, hydrophobic membrane anchor protein, partial [Dokdonella sp.]
MSRFDRMRTPLKNARGLGAAKTGVRHFIAQRSTAVALVFLAIHALVLLISVIGS